MANKNYVAGRSYEYKCKKALEEQGYQVIRTAGSHGFADVIGIKTGEKVRCIEVKRTKSPNGVKQLLGKFIPTHSPDDTWIHEMWVWFSGRWYYS